MAADASSGGTTIALVVGLVTAFATIIVAWVNGRTARRDSRDNLKRDVELVKQLRDDSTAKKILEDSITRRIRVLSNESSSRVLLIGFFITFALTEGALAALVVRQYVSHPESIDRGLTAIAIGGIGGLVFFTFRLNGNLKTLVNRWPLDFDPPTSTRFRTKLRNALRIPNISAAWKVLVSSPPADDPRDSVPNDANT